MSIIRIIEPHTKAVIAFSDLRPKEADCHPSHHTRGYDHPFEVRRINHASLSATTLTPEPYSYLSAVDAVHCLRHRQRAAIDALYVSTLAAIEDTSTATEVEGLLQECLREDFVIPQELDSTVAAALDTYRNLLVQYFLETPVFTVQSKNNTLRGVSYGLFYGLPGHQPCEIDFTIA